MSGHRTHRATVVAGLAVAAAGLLIGSPAATAATPAKPGVTGVSRLTLGGPAADALKRSGVKVTVVAPGKREGGSFLLPVSGGSVNAAGTTAIVAHRGALRLKRGKRTVTLQAPTVKIGKRSALQVRVGKQTSSLFTVTIPRGASKLTGASQTVVVQNVGVRLTPKAAKTLTAKLGLRGSKRLRAGRFANLLTDAVLRPVGSSTTPVAPAPSAPAAPASDRPATAVPIASAAVVWRQRTSWLQYIQSGKAGNPQGGTTALEGAVPGPVESLPTSNGDPVAIPYTYSFPFAAGWYDPVSGTASVSFTGAIRHLFPAHTIDLTVRNPRIVLNGAQSQLQATVSGQAGSVLPATTGTYVALNAAASPRTVEGNVVTITNIPGSVPTGAGAGVFQGFYPDGDPYGAIDRLQLTLAQ